jgi:pseudouridine kinase
MTTNERKPGIAIIGGAEVAIASRPLGQLQYGPENPGTISMECRGKAWTIARDLIKAGCRVEYISVAGNDFPGHAMKSQLKEFGAGVDHFHLVEGKNTAASHEILNLLDQPEMEFQNGDVFDCLTSEMIQGAKGLLAAADCILIETRFPEETLRHVVSEFPQTPILVLTDTEQNASRASSVLGQIHGILSGRREAEVLSGLSILSEEELMTAAAWFSGKGVKQVFFDLGFGGLYYKDPQGEGAERPGPARLAPVLTGIVEGLVAAEIAANAIKTNTQRGG